MISANQPGQRFWDSLPGLSLLWRSRTLWYLFACYLLSWSARSAGLDSFKSDERDASFLSSPKEVWMLIHRSTLSSPRGSWKLILPAYWLCAELNSIYQTKPPRPSFPRKIYCARTIRVPRLARQKIDLCGAPLEKLRCFFREPNFSFPEWNREVDSLQSEGVLNIPVCFDESGFTFSWEVEETFFISDFSQKEFVH